MAMKHLDNPRQILALMKKCKVAKESAKDDSVTFYGMGVIFNYALWKSEGFKKLKLNRFNLDVSNLAKQYIDDVSELNDRLWGKAGFSYQLDEVTGKDLGYTKCKYLNSHIERMAFHNNLIGYESARYLCVAMNVLISYGYGEKRLTRIKDYVNVLLNENRPIESYELEMRSIVGIEFQK